jgi:NAD(P)-dependent dehydrogenase (short-subunit alcohol dehydrogenase family)
MKIEKSVFLISWAGSGLGAAVAAMAVEAGARAVLLDVNKDSGAALAAELGETARFVRTDVNNPDDGVASLILPAARERARHAIRVMAIAPGMFDTPMVSGLPQDVQASLGASVPFPQRLGQSVEYAALVRHIVQNPMLNGEVIRLDGALRMPPH